MISAETTLPTLLDDSHSYTLPLPRDPMPLLLGGDDLPTLLGGTMSMPMLVGLTIAATAGLVGLAALHGSYFYGDWTCAFKRCVVVRDKRGRALAGSATRRRRRRR